MERALFSQFPGLLLVMGVRRDVLLLVAAHGVALARTATATQPQWEFRERFHDIK
jgi:hypothetical protein